MRPSQGFGEQGNMPIYFQGTKEKLYTELGTEISTINNNNNNSNKKSDVLYVWNEPVQWVTLQALKWKHSIVESANIIPGLPHLVICYGQNVEKLTG